jgi:hypothetical protein
MQVIITVQTQKLEAGNQEAENDFRTKYLLTGQ